VERQNEMKYLAEYKSQLEIAQCDKVPIAQIAHIFLLAQWNMVYSKVSFALDTLAFTTLGWS
jgi:hypothetical protein